MLTPETVLFVHEGTLLRSTVCAVLRTAGFAVDAAATGRDAERHLRARRFSALVVDVALSDMLGYELGTRAKAWAHQSPGAGSPICILFASTYRPASYRRVPARLYGADDYIEGHRIGELLPAKLRVLLDQGGVASKGTVPECRHAVALGAGTRGAYNDGEEG